MNWLMPTILQGQHATLVPLTMEHHSELIEAVQDGELWKLWFATVPSPENMPAEIQRRLRLQEQGLMLPFTVIDNKTQQAVGMTTYWQIDAVNRRVEIGWTWYRKSRQRTALNTECKLLLFTYAFETLNCIAVELRANFFNHASRKAIERLGAKLDGVLRHRRIMANGLLADFYVYSVLNHEWPAVKTNLLWKLESSHVHYDDQQLAYTSHNRDF